MPGDSDADWVIYRTIDSVDDAEYIKVLRDGSPIPDIAPFLDQAQIADFVTEYVDVESGTIRLNANQVICLFEFNPSLVSAAADFQDLVVLLNLHPTMGVEGSGGDGDDEGGEAGGDETDNTKTFRKSSWKPHKKGHRHRQKIKKWKKDRD